MRAIVLASTALVFATHAYAAPTVRLGGSVTATEGQAVPMAIIKTGSGRAKFGIRTVPDTATAADFAPVNRVISPYGSTVEAISTADDAIYEGPERLKVQLYPVAGSKTIVDTTPQYITILDNDPPPAPPTKVCPDGSVVVATIECPEVPVPPQPPVIEGVGTAPIPTTDFDVSTSYLPAGIPGTGAPDIVGAFRFVCGAGQLLYDDPILYPNQPGKSHLHQFYGHLGANANSTHASLRADGDSTCNSTGTQDGTGDAANRSAYWMPAMLDGKGNVVKPNYVVIYYKRLPDSDSRCHPETNPLAWGKCVTIPNGLKFIFGFDMVTGKPPTGGMYYNCKRGTAGQYPNMPAAAPNCPAGSSLLAIIRAPECWDGKNLDSPNHRDHVSFREASGTRKGQCPTTHPYLFPQFTLTADYSVEAGDDLIKWSLSSDVMHPELPAGSTYHADYFEAWDPTVKLMWTKACIDKLLTCTAGNLGNGFGLKNADAPTYLQDTGTYAGRRVRSWTIPLSQRLVPVPVNPHAGH